MARHTISFDRYIRETGSPFDPDARHVEEIWAVAGGWGRWAISEAVAFAFAYGESTPALIDADLVGRRLVANNGSRRVGLELRCQRASVDETRTWVAVAEPSTPILAAQMLLESDPERREVAIDEALSATWARVSVPGTASRPVDPRSLDVLTAWTTAGGWGLWVAHAALAFALEHGNAEGIRLDADLVNGELVLNDGTRLAGVQLGCRRTRLSDDHVWISVTDPQVPRLTLQAVLEDDPTESEGRLDVIRGLLFGPWTEDRDRVRRMALIALGVGSADGEVRDARLRFER